MYRQRFVVPAGITPAALIDLVAVKTRRRPEQSLTQTWLDTFDRRLLRAGLALSHEAGGDGATLHLSAEAIDPDLTQPSQRTLPTLLPSLPAGRIRDRISKLLDDRTLLPLVTVHVRRTVIDIHNDDAKTVARLLLEVRNLALPAAVTVEAILGYEPAAQRIAARLAADGRLQLATGSPLHEALQAAGAVAPPQGLDVELAAEQPAGAAVATILLRLLDTAEANVDGTLRDLDPEFLHDLRVAVRRSRSAVKLLADVLPPRASSRFAGELKWLGDLTTPSRDLDVYLAAVQPLVERDPALKPFYEFLAERRAVRHELVAGLRSARFRRFVRDWRALLGNPLLDSEPIKVIAARATRRAYTRVRKLGRAIGPHSAPADLHNLRKRCKELRYLLEMFASLHDADTQQSVVAELKRLQDVLGEYQDTNVQLEQLRAFADEMIAARRAPSDTLLAMGRLTSDLERRQEQARSQFGTVFARFDRARNRHRLAELTA
jgi:CHAD domain-containing protein